MPATALNAVALGHNVALDTSNGAAADTVNNNSAPNNGSTILVIQTGATPGTVAVTVTRKVDGKSVADVNILDTAGAALAANKTYLVGLGNPGDYGNAVTVKCTQATTKVTVVAIGG